MLTSYRIFKTKHAATWFDGKGAFLYGGRWNTRGTRILYSSANLSLAALEMLVNLNAGNLLQSYSFASIEFEEKFVLSVEKAKKLPANWSNLPAPIVIQEIGDKWAESKSSVVLKVPSAVLPIESNYLINIEHPNFSKISLGEPQSFNFDKRLYNRT